MLCRYDGRRKGSNIEKDQLSITESELIEQWDNMVSLSGVKMGYFLMPWL